MFNSNKISKTIYENFLGSLTKKGNKTSAKRILDSAFLKVSRQLNIPSHIVLTKVFLLLNTFVEVKKIRIKRSTHIVPFPITFKRKSYLIIKWLMEATREDTRKVSTSEKLSTELINVLKKSSSKALLKKKLNTDQSLFNRSNIHFRW